MAKFYIILEGVDSGLFVLMVALVINSVIGLFYYLRVITALFSKANDITYPAISFSGHLVLAVLTTGILWLGIFPEWFFHFIGNF
jgi:NADH-quinone oxidoreductase subunit N